MHRSLHLVLFVLVSLMSPLARAQQAQWLDGTFVFQPGLSCLNWNVETAVTTFAGYWGTTTGSFPKTGDVTYMRAVAGVVGNSCSGTDAIGFDFQMPKGAVLAVSAQIPVQCLATRLSDGLVTSTDANIHCQQTASAGTMGGLSFGWALVPQGWMFEIRVPVELDRELLGMAGPSADNLKIGMTASNGSVVAEQWVTAPYRPLINYPSPSATYVSGTNYQLTSYIYNFYKGGTAVIEAGSSPGSYAAVPTSAITIGGTTKGSTMSTLVTVATGYSGTVYWRTRFDSTSGTFYGADQSFVANATTPASYALTVTKTGSGTGSVTSSPQGLVCGSTCSQSFTSGSVVTLTATPDPGSQFSGWSGGGCSGTGSCVVSVTGTTSVSAAFAPAPVPTVGTLDVTVSGLPTGAIGHIAVTGPGGYSHTFDLMSGTGQSLSDVAPGQYVGTVGNVLSGGSTWIGQPATLSAGVLAGGKGLLAATYSAAALTARKSANAPADSTRAPGDAVIPVLAFDLEGSVSGQLDALTLQATGSGNDAVDLTTVQLYEDTNGNGLVDAGESPVAAGAFATNDGALTLTPASPRTLPAGVAHYLVTVSMASTLAAGVARAPTSIPRAGSGSWPLTLALLAGALVLFALHGSRRPWRSAALLVVLAACGGGETPVTTPPTQPTPHTYHLTLTSIAAQSGAQPAVVAGLPVDGATLTVQ